MLIRYHSYIYFYIFGSDLAGGACRSTLCVYACMYSVCVCVYMCVCIIYVYVCYCSACIYICTICNLVQLVGLRFSVVFPYLVFVGRSSHVCVYVCVCLCAEPVFWDAGGV